MRWVDRTANASEETRVTPTFPSRRLGATVASGLCLCAAAMLLAPPPPAMARAPGVACPSSAARHVERGAPACGRSARRGGLHARVRAKGHRAGQEVRRARGHHAKHEVRRVKSNKRRATKPPAVTGRIGGAVCEDGTAPILAGDGSVSCQDGSEPVCEGAAGAALSSDGSAPVCDGAVVSSSGSAAVTCEDGTAPTLTGDASFSCRDGSEPVCEGGAGATPSSDGSALVCEPAGLEERPG